MTSTKSTKAEVAIIVPQREEYRAVRRVFSIPAKAPVGLIPHGGTYVLSEIAMVSSLRTVRIAIACMDYMYNYPCLALAERILQHLEPELVFLVGSACGNVRKAKVCDVVVATNAVAYLGRGRRQGEVVNPRPYTEPIAEKMRNAITTYMAYQAVDFNRWNRRCRWLLRRICGTSVPEGFSHRSVFEIKSGLIASDDLVLAWLDESEARNFWAKHVLEEARAYDMESAGFSHACARRNNQPNWTVVRGISDHGVDGTNKYHLAATTIAAEWLRGFISEGAGGLLDRKSRLRISKAILRTLFSLLEKEEKKNLFVGKRRFIRETLRSDAKSVRALESAIANGEIEEYEVTNPNETGRSTTAIRLDRGSQVDKIEM